MTAWHRPDAGVEVRWLGGGVAQLWSADGALLYIDAWLWNNAGWDRFEEPKPPWLASADSFAQSVSDRNAEVVAFLITHDHRDHMEDLYEALWALRSAGVATQVVMQSDLARAGLVDAFAAAGLDPAALIVTDGAGVNIGGRTALGPATVTAVPAVHSTLAGYPAIGYVVDLAGATLYCSGDTDVFGDMRLIGERYSPDLALLCVGGGPFTMDPAGAALAANLLRCSSALPIHYAHNPHVLGVEAGAQFSEEVAARGLSTRVLVPRPGEPVVVQGA